MRSAKVDDAVSLAWGLPSFRTPDHIRRAVTRRLDTDPDIGMYALLDGLPEFRRAAAREHLAATGIKADPDQNAMITAGNMQGLNALFHVPLDPSDEVIVTDPGFANVSARTGDGYAGWPEQAPFDGIIVTAAAPSVPQPLLDQLRRRGRMVIPVGKGVFGQDLMVIEKDADGRIRTCFPSPSSH